MDSSAFRSGDSGGCWWPLILAILVGVLAFTGGVVAGVFGIVGWLALT